MSSAWGCVPVPECSCARGHCATGQVGHREGSRVPGHGGTHGTHQHVPAPGTPWGTAVPRAHTDQEQELYPSQAG